MAIPTAGTGGGSSSGGSPSGLRSQGSVAAFAQMIANAAKQYNVPAWILVGIFGMETSFGTNVSTSSAGAEGLMQFIPSTAHQYGYPLTNNPTAQQAQQQFNAAAHLLSDLYHQHGNSWAAAITGYSGGGYGLSQVQAQVKTNTGVAFAKAIGSIALGSSNPGAYGVTPGPGTLGSVNISLPAALEQIAALLTSTEFWLRLGEALAGIILLAMGLRSLTGSTTTPASVARAVRAYV